MTLIPVHETFGPTLQGEGSWAGMVVSFIRLSGCPVACPWCDTGYADGGANLPREKRSIESLVTEIKTSRVVISGGEPFIHPQLPELVKALFDDDKYTAIETSGSFWQDVPDCWITLSPKEHINPRYPVQEKIWTAAREIKLVVKDGSEVEYYRDRLLHFNRVFLQPEWESKKTSLPIVLDLLYKNPNWRLSLQTHKYIGVQ
jgi:7-carboxy-7-deazaguanine synthase